MSFCQEGMVREELNPEITPCKPTPAPKIEVRVSRRERSSSPKLKQGSHSEGMHDFQGTTNKVKESSEPSSITEALSAVSVLKLHCFLCSSASDSNFRFQLLSQCLQVILECIQVYVLNSNEKVDVHAESVNRIFMKL
jgi:hypothetical protein